jgi:hypothetical protein
MTRTGALYTLAEVKSALLAYVERETRARQQQYLNVSANAVFSAALYGSPRWRRSFCSGIHQARRGAELAERAHAAWYRIAVSGEEPFTKKGALCPNGIATKVTQGRKTCTCITGFEQFQLSGDALLRR